MKGICTIKLRRNNILATGGECPGRRRGRKGQKRNKTEKGNGKSNSIKIGTQTPILMQN